MSKPEIRVHYSGLIIFAAQILSLASGIIFTLLLTRNMTENQYGIWANIFDWIGYFTFFSGLFPFWAMRFVVRGKEGAVKTGLFANMIVSLVSMAFYFPLISLITNALYISEPYVILYFAASVQIINLHLIAMFESCLRGIKPQAIGYGLLIEEVCKVSLAYVLIVMLRQLFLGAMVSLVVAGSIQALYYMRLLTKDLRQKIQWSYLREWLKGSTANLYNAIGNQMAAFIFILLFIYGGQAARAEYQAAATFANVVGYSSFLAFALYPKLLAQNSLEGATSSLKMIMMFAMPMAAIVIGMSQSLLAILNVTYSVASPLLVLLALDAIVLLISQFYNSLLFSVEKLDEEAKIPLNKLVRSQIFKVFTLPYVQACIVLPTGYFILTHFAAGQPLQAVLYATAINMTAHVITFLGLYRITHHSVRITVPWTSIAKYFFASTIAAILVYLVAHPTTILLTFVTTVSGLAIYAALLLAIDKDTRELAAAIWYEIKAIATLRL